ncbi:MAG: hypothetical protein SFU83_12060 [Meiothermus sp.]|nr:hypothetical protein [Meiothermus sp.]
MVEKPAHNSVDLAPRGPDVESYFLAFLSVELTEFEREILRLHFRSSKQTLTSKDLSNLMGFESEKAASIFYRKLGEKVARQLNWSLLRPLESLVKQDKPSTGKWVLRPQVGIVLVLLGIVEAPNKLVKERTILPKTRRSFREGDPRKVQITEYRRSKKARIACIEHYGWACCICGFDFLEVYGDVADGFIHVHHENQISEKNQEYEVDPVRDLKPVCPNCHAVLHMGDPVFTIEEVKTMLRK